MDYDEILNFLNQFSKREIFLIPNKKDIKDGNIFLIFQYIIYIIFKLNKKLFIGLNEEQLSIVKLK
jgi:hypothetical protein